MATKKQKKPIKKPAKKTAKKVATPSETRVVVQLQQQPETSMALFEPMRDGKNMTLAKTWMNDKQLLKIVQRTPQNETYKRQGKGGKEFTYVTGNYIIKALNFAFGWNWDFEVMEHGIEKKQIWVKGKLTVKSPDGKQSITKTQFGRADIKFLRDGTGHVDFGNDLKAASTDSMKKCASLLGIASDIYGKMEYKEEANVEIKEPVVTVAKIRDSIDTSESQEVPDEDMVIGPDGKPTHICAVCGDPISKQGYLFTKKLYKKALCREHATLAGKKK